MVRRGFKDLSLSRGLPRVVGKGPACLGSAFEIPETGDLFRDFRFIFSCSFNMSFMKKIMFKNRALALRTLHLKIEGGLRF